MSQQPENKDNDNDNKDVQYALITGASSGMGGHLCKTLLDVDWKVIMISRNAEKMKENIPSDKENNAFLISVDLSNMSECEKACKQLTEYLTDKCKSTLNLMVHAAGASKPGLTIDKCSLDDWNWQINLHVTSLFMLTKYCTPFLVKHMFLFMIFLSKIIIGNIQLMYNITKEKGEGSIVNISSIVTSTPFIDATTYAVAKGAVDTFTKCAALELGSKKIRVNCVAPGVVKTNFGVNMGFPKEGADAFVEDSAKFTPLRMLYV